MERCAAVGVQPSLKPEGDFAEKISVRLREAHGIKNRSVNSDEAQRREVNSDEAHALEVNLQGAHQIHNASVAIRLAEALRLHGFAISSEEIGFGLAAVTHAGRLELIPPFLLDGAHNPAGAQALRDYLEELNPPALTLVFAAMRDKKLDQIAKTLFPLANCLVLTVIDNQRSAEIETLAALAKQFAPGVVVETASSTEAVHTALSQTPDNGLICITGSLYLIGETRPLVLQLAQQHPATSGTNT